MLLCFNADAQAWAKLLSQKHQKKMLHFQVQSLTRATLRGLCVSAVNCRLPGGSELFSQGHDGFDAEGSPGGQPARQQHGDEERHACSQECDGIQR